MIEFLLRINLNIVPVCQGRIGNAKDARIYGKAMDDKQYKIDERGRTPFNIITEEVLSD